MKRRKSGRSKGKEQKEIKNKRGTLNTKKEVPTGKAEVEEKQKNLMGSEKKWLNISIQESDKCEHRLNSLVQRRSFCFLFICYSVHNKVLLDDGLLDNATLLV